MVLDENAVKARIAGREASRELREAGMLCWPDGYGAQFGEGFCEVFPRQAASVDAAFSEAQQPFARLAATKIEFGQHCGSELSEVPIEYLDWLCREQEAFLKVLRAYLKHPENPENQRCD